MGRNTGRPDNGGELDKSEIILHINRLELTAAMFTVMAFCTDVRVEHMLIRVDNTTIMCYINNMGGKKNDCYDIVRQM